MLVHLSTVVLSVTLIICLINFIQECYHGACKFYLGRCIFSIIVSLMVAGWGLKKKSLNWSGVISGIFVGFIHSYSSYCFLACLFTFFYTSSKATHFHSEKKRKLEAEFKEGGQRNWHQVLCNGSASTFMAMLCFLYAGPGEKPFDFKQNYYPSWLSAAVLSALAGANGDTWASEIGTVMAKKEPLLITSLRKVPVGTNGGFTAIGLISSALGGTVVGVANVIVLFLSNQHIDILQQVFLSVFIGTCAGFFGSIFDSLIGATLQYSGLDTKTGKIVEKPGIGVKHISGRPLFDNHSVNMIMTIITSIAVPTIIAQLDSCFR
ncbi:transmembrane protein 19 [Caerostris darwini]|uniref:Transmembrane protein 19 n=1 Tax=Caerostris darwini TaxID=1538125 RepID=A0AAV4R6E7_9ARAC|nr:transmembrane protein 19 [Caerostris darwini]